MKNLINNLFKKKVLLSKVCFAHKDVTNFINLNNINVFKITTFGQGSFVIFYWEKI